MVEPKEAPMSAAGKPDEPKCPVQDDYRIERGNDLAPLEVIDELTKMRAKGPIFWTPNEEGYYVLTTHDTIRDAFQQPEIFSSSRLSPNVPQPEFDLIPITMDPPRHTKWRKVLGSYFTPKRSELMEDRIRQEAIELIEEFQPSGQCEFVKDFSSRFPAAIFLEMMGMPKDEMSEFLEWVSKAMRGPNPDDPEGKEQINAQLEVMQYMWKLIQDRRENPDPNRRDIISEASEWRVDGEPPTDQELLLCCLTLFQAGLDTVNSMLSFFFYHLATHPADRDRIAGDFTVIPNAVEEMLRAFPIARVGREVVAEHEVAGCPLKPGDRVLLATNSAGRDESMYTNPDQVDFDRETIRHLTFGAGPHRCIGSHLARRELAVALEEWHRRIPVYEISDMDAVTERSGQISGIANLPLRW